MEKLIPFLVKRIKKVFLKKWIGKKLDQFDINVFGTENISKFKNGSFVLASNHLLSKDGGLLKSGISSDSFIIRKVVFHETGKKLAITAGYIALRHKLPIVPVYIKGANLWKPGQKIYLYFGKSFDSDDLTIDKISER